MMDTGAALTIRVADWNGSVPGTTNDLLICRKLEWIGTSYALNIDCTGMTNFSDVAKSFIIATATSADPNSIFPPGSNVIQIHTTNFTGSGNWKVNTSGNNLVMIYTPDLVAGYAIWAASRGLTAANNGTDQDPDHDGINNLTEYCLAGDPLASDSSILPRPAIVGAHLVLNYQRTDASETDTTLIGQWSADNQNWHDIAPILVNENGANPDDMRVSIPLGNAVDGKLFGRLKLTKP